MLLAAERQGCLREMLIIVSGLSIQDPRERPAEQREQGRRPAPPVLERRCSPELSETAPGACRRARQPALRQAQHAWQTTGRGQRLPRPAAPVGLPARVRSKPLSGNAFRRMCRDEFLHFLRVREWQDLHAQLKQICRELGLDRNDAAGAARPGAHRRPGRSAVPRRAGRPPRGARRRPAAVAAGRAPREYLGARGTRFAINPGSSLARIQPPLVMAAEIVETTRLWARTVAPITAEQVEEVGEHLLKRQLLRAALVGPRRVGDGVRAGQPVRRPDRRPAGGSATARSTRPRRGRSSSGRPWSRGSGGPGTTSSATTRRCGPRPRHWRSGPAAAT